MADRLLLPTPFYDARQMSTGISAREIYTLQSVDRHSAHTRIYKQLPVHHATKMQSPCVAPCHCGNAGYAAT